ncbi:MAG: O-antigen ligase family protein [Actinomycetota bacterium]|nr:O-antigen ligase family protein [Actinomycetota bacterium]
MALLTARPRPATAAVGALVAVNLVVLAMVVAGWAWVALAAAVLVPLTGALVARPQRGILLLAGLLPFHSLLLVAGFPAWADRWKEGLVLAVLAATFVAPSGARGVRRPLPGWAPAMAGLFAVSVFSGLLVGGLQAVVGLKIAFFFVLVAVIVWRCPLDATERDHLVTILMVCGVVTALYGIAQQVLGPARLNQLGYAYNDTIRTTGGFLRSFSTFNQPFGLGFFLMVVLLVGVPHALGQPGRLRSRLFLLSVPILVVALALTFVRGAWLGLAAGLAYLGFTRFRVVLLAIPITAVALLFLPSDVSLAALGSASGIERVNTWNESVNRIVANPLGVGVGSSGSASEKVAELQGRGAIYQPDNYYVKTVYELGVLGLWMLLLLLAAAFMATRADSRRLAPNDAILSTSVSALVLAVAVASLVATYFEIFPMDAYFWLLLGVVAACEPASR